MLTKLEALNERKSHPSTLLFYPSYTAQNLLQVVSLLLETNMTNNHAAFSNWRDELVPNIVDHLARVAPDATYALFPKSPVTYSEGYRTVSYKDFANAVNGLAWWLHETLGPSQNFEVLAYVGPNDVRYTALLLGAIKAGYVVSYGAAF